jgi:2-dehydropantoate 2-reductase
VRVCIFGAGGVGSYLAVQFALAQGFDVSVIARGEQLRAIQRGGLTLLADGQRTHTENVVCVDHASKLPQQDFVFVAVKAHALPGIADDLASLIGDNGAVVFANNGIPWWWNYGLPGHGGHLHDLDPEGRLWRTLGPERAIGCVLYSANNLVSPGVVDHLGNNRWIIGEPTNQHTPRIAVLEQAMLAAGLNVSMSNDLRLEIWKKLLRNAPFNSLCALTRLPAADFCKVPGLIEMAQAIACEVIAVAAAKGWHLPGFVAEDVVRSGGLINGASPKPNALPSMLQDILQARPMEIEAILGQIYRFSQDERVPAPVLHNVLCILRGLDISRIQAGCVA